MYSSLVLLAFLVFASPAQAAETLPTLDLSKHWVGYAAIVVFIGAYVLVALEEKIRLKKSKPVLLASSVIWILIALAYSGRELSHEVETGIRHHFLEYAELFFFLLVAMTYINAMLERGVFAALRDWLISREFSYRSLFWTTGFIAFVLSPIADNLTTALIMCAVIMAVAEGQPKFVAVCSINIVVAANAGGAFSPFGDITTLMVWQKDIIKFWDFFALFVPSLINFLLPACFMQLALPYGTPKSPELGESALKYGGPTIAVLFLLTIATAVCFHNFLHIPPVYGMMTGLVYLKFFGFYLKHKSISWDPYDDKPPGTYQEDPYDFDIFRKIAHAEWDTLFFFYGVILSVGGLSFIGYLELLSDFIYGQFDISHANILVGLLSALVDNIPVMFAVLSMQPDMNHTQWLLVTLTVGVGGSLLSIGSASGVALMGQTKGQYTFFSHLKWSPVIALGYGFSIWVHLMLSA